MLFIKRKNRYFIKRRNSTKNENFAFEELNCERTKNSFILENWQVGNFTLKITDFIFGDRVLFIKEFS